MKKMTSTEIRQMWLDFFKSKKHQIESSASLVPQNDPTLLWINAGVAPLKKYFDGSEQPQNPRMANVQKCIRTNDIDNVGKTARHHTFFEMLGNFSIGNYFKDQAIAWGFELLTDSKWFDFPKEKLYITYYPDDLEARDAWIRQGIDPSHIIPREDNFWEIGPGPCGPDTEIYFDRGESYDQRGIELIEQDIENERYIEIWNIVFSQYNSKPGLSREAYPELPSKNIDTGAGLERFACVIQQTATNFETDLFLPIILHTQKLSGITYQGQMAFKVIADHIKALTFAISDGAILSNEGRGYVLRRLLRRAVKYGLSLNLTRPFLYELVDDVVDIMGSFYTNLEETKTIVKQLIFREEEKFLSTINEGEKHLNDAISIEGNKLSGQTAFKLYDTFGFPIELTMEYAEEKGVSVDIDAFNVELDKQRNRSRAARQQMSSMKNQEEMYLNFTEPSLFVGYDQLQVEAKVIKVFDEGIVLDKTPFYATSGGQVADKGWINGLEVKDVYKLPHGQFLHRVEGDYQEGEEVLAVVDKTLRQKTMKNHSAAHLFHQAIKDIFGKHANQQGSQVAPWSWRFDFNHFETETDERIVEVEKLVNYYIKQQPLDVKIRELPLEEAKKIGAMALFGEKYGDIVRVVDMGWSKELCGGTHVKNTSDIKAFAIMQYESIGSGVYRMEGITGPNLKEQVTSYLETFEQEIQSISEKIKKMDEKHNIPSKPEIIGSYQDIINYRNYLDELKELAKQYEKENIRKSQEDVLKRLDEWILDVTKKKQLIVTKDLDPKVLKQLIDALYDKIKAETLMLINIGDSKATYLCKSSHDDADQLIKKATLLSNGSGGGKGQFAQGGTQQLDLVDLVIKEMSKHL
ncbi:MAG: alanine--tRNA ligase [Acholeplasmataceae bacterium]|jgi:alanyl-tRNA synthetase|nr:alanine--tRNA ligase [Acholeplasmataceae bacterium]